MSLLQSTPQGASASGMLEAKRERDNSILESAKAEGEAREAATQAAAQVEEGRKAGLSWDAAYNEAPPHIQQLMKQMRADYTRKTQEIANERKSLASEREALIKSGVLGKLKAQAEADAGELNPFDEASVSARIEKEVARRLHEALAPLEQEHKQAQAKQEYHGFLEKNPDLKSDPALRKEVYETLQKNPSLDLESAYYAVKGRQLTSAHSQAQARKQAEKEAARAAALTATGSGKRVGSPVLNASEIPSKPGDRMDAWAVYEQLKRQSQR